ncbi:hypothetical protein ASD11_14215 [Aeromicrobium sp. Root495]|uniref:hypothetical protein n=2 Tax=Bacteria TaxID=2 RepID=UPI0006FD0F6F|nr:hypothetical protein [Aeromicrobium sp. Root495]KQY55666.1 hypothetical protein ASD11_14215 [Aeromicrobium sp. Root495]
MTVRQWMAYPVSGDHELLRHWPDNPFLDHEALDEGYLPDSALRVVPHALSEDFRYVWDNEPTWSLSPTTGAFVDERLEWALYTYIDLTLDEEEAVADGRLNVRSIFEARRAHIEPIVKAVATQVDRYFDEELPELLNDLVERRRRTLTNRKAVLESLTFPDDWKASPPAVFVGPDPTAEASGVGQEASNPGGGVEAELRENVIEIAVEKRARLSPVAFEDVLRTMRVWANAIERTPDAFSQLDEDRISDLLAATLNATLPGADREVYTQAGKSDIFVRADTLSEEFGPARVFICESKKATSHRVIAEAVDPQLFGYLNVHDTSAVVLILVHQQSLQRTRETYTRVLESVVGHQRTRDSIVEGWPLLTYENQGRMVEVCAAFVHVRRPRRQ